MEDYDHIPNVDAEHSILNSMLGEYFHHQHFKNKTQRDAISKIMKRETDVIVSLPKGHGRTLCFQFPILICQRKVSIVFVGVSSRVNMQIARLNRREIHVEIIDARTSLEEFDNIKNTINNLSHIRSTLNSMLYVTTDVVPTVDFLNLLHHLVMTNSLGFIVVDTSYCENDWISGQTDKYQALRRLRNTYLQIPWIVTTQKASYEIASCITSTLCLRTQRPDILGDSIPWFTMNIEDDDVLVDR
ncbi:ATP-dependent DNA helicase Q5-like [Metopolophium dirhodum]|uniref:ATP-dependent DNA helicase Q5-like n=1 Tax=Metopolophium dirhodum TaxID=44670 RepID=UPI00298F5F2B|nr:ATP-dependent DNA helicase Q5-like [Metopolophium dirhodum]